MVSTKQEVIMNYQTCSYENCVHYTRSAVRTCCATCKHNYKYSTFIPSKKGAKLIVEKGTGGRKGSTVLVVERKKPN